MRSEELVILKENLIKYAQTLGISKVGFTTAEPLLKTIDKIKLREAKGYRFNTNAGEMERKVNPTLHLPEAKSVIIIAVAYGKTMEDTLLKDNSEEGKRGYFAKVSWGRDYHRVLKELLAKLVDYLIKNVPGAKTLTMVDTGHLLEKSLAERAGLGWIGKNSLLITSEFGSYLSLGLLLTDIQFPADSPIKNQCGGCSQCRISCPTQALEEDNLNLDRCLGNLCLYSDLIDDELREKFSYLYGCDACQEVCPYNQGKYESLPDFEPKPDEYNPLLKDFFVISNQEFKNRFGHLAGSWRGKRPILRNAIILAGNHRDEKATPYLKELLKNNPHPDIQATAAWALGKIGTLEAEQTLKEVINHNYGQDEKVRVEVEKALKRIIEGVDV